MTEPQIWTLIGVFAAAIVGLFSVLVVMLTVTSRSFSAQLASLREETAARFEAVHQELASMRRETAAQFETVRAELAHLNKGMQAIATRVFPE